MSFARFLATGSGALAVRVMIEGLGTEFVSDPALEKTTSDGRARVYALPAMGEGIVIQETVNVPEAVIDADSVSISLWETEDQSVSQALAFRPSLERFVTSHVEQAATTIQLLSTSGISAGDVLHMGTEAVYVSSVDSSTQISVTRSHWNTIAQKHWTGTELRAAYAMATDRPLRIRGRRVYIYAYGSADDPQGDGTQIWLGMVAMEPSLGEAGMRWQVNVASISKVLESRLGGELENPLFARGIYYSAGSPLYVQVTETVSTGPTTTPADDKYTRFHETQEDFVDTFTDWLQSAGSESSDIGDAGFASTIRAVITSDGRWTFQVVVGTNVTNIQIQCVSIQDGVTSFNTEDWLAENGERYGSFTTGDVLYAMWKWSPAGARMVPRGYLGQSPFARGVALGGISGSGGANFREPAAAATYPDSRIYLNRGVSSDWEAAVISLAADAEFSRDWEGMLKVDTVNTSSNYVEVNRTLSAAYIPGRKDPIRGVIVRTYDLGRQLTLRPVRSLADGGLVAFRAALLTESALFANRGTAPFITTADLASWSNASVEENGRPWLVKRQYRLATRVDLKEMLAAELRMRSMFPIIDATGKIALANLEIPNPSSQAVTDIDDEIVSVGWAESGRGNQTVNRWVFRTGYNPVSDEWEGVTVDPIDVTAYSQDHQDRPLEVSPRSTYVSGDASIPYEAVAEMALPVLGLFGYPHDFVKVNVSWKLFSTVLGDWVRMDLSALPSFASGIRPATNVLGIVTGRKWELGQPYGELTVLVPWHNVRGYSPTGAVTAQVNDSGNTWTVTLAASAYLPAAAAATDFWVAGDKILMREYDTWSATTVTGTIDSVNEGTGQVTITFDSTWTPGSSTWEFGYRPWSVATDSMKNYGAIADSGGLLGTDGPHLYAP